jgi:hypothetical protein
MPDLIVFSFHQTERMIHLMKVAGQSEVVKGIGAGW